MIYAKWESLTEVKKRLYKVSLTENFDKGGVPIFKENKDIYISKESSNTLVIANSDAEKEKNFISPSIDLSIKAGESLVINDRKGVLYEEKKEILKENGYNVIKVDFGDPLNGNSWNPLSIIQKAYKEDNSLADELIENLGSYLFRERKSTDPFGQRVLLIYLVE